MGPPDLRDTVVVVSNDSNPSLHWRTPTNGEDSFSKFLRRFYFPFLARCHIFVCVAWLAIFVVSIVYGPNFLSATRPSSALPNGTPSQEALVAFQLNYPGVSRHVEFENVELFVCLTF